MLKVWRVEHKCSHPHGPLARCRDNYRDESPAYGGALETPDEDPLLAGKSWDAAFIFGTLEEMFPRWWSGYYDPQSECWRQGSPKSLAGDWWAVLYEVAEERAHIGTNQVIFDSYFAKEIFSTQTDFPR